MCILMSLIRWFILILKVQSRAQGPQSALVILIDTMIDQTKLYIYINYYNM